ncbi:hypothetical protein V8E36_004328, partial [Tilletia maclaganii]
MIVIIERPPTRAGLRVLAVLLPSWRLILSGPGAPSTRPIRRPLRSCAIRPRPRPGPRSLLHRRSQRERRTPRLRALPPFPRARQIAIDRIGELRSRIDDLFAHPAGDDPARAGLVLDDGDDEEGTTHWNATFQYLGTVFCNALIVSGILLTRPETQARVGQKVTSTTSSSSSSLPLGPFIFGIASNLRYAFCRRGGYLVARPGL